MKNYRVYQTIQEVKTVYIDVKADSAMEASELASKTEPETWTTEQDAISETYNIEICEENI